MKDGLLIFGNKDLASLAHFYAKQRHHYVAAFVVDPEYCDASEFEGKPLIDIKSAMDIYYPPDKYDFFAPIADNKLRAAKYKQIKSLGYEFISIVHPTSVISSEIGDNCFILERNVIQPYVKVDNNLIMWTQNHIGHHSKIGSYVFMASGVVVCGHCNIKDHAWLGANCTIRDGVTIAEGSSVGMHAAVVKDTEPGGIYYGVPATRSNSPKV